VLFGGVFDLPDKIEEVKTLERKATEPDLWDNPDQARVLMQRLSALQDEIAYWTGLRQEIQDTQELLALEDEGLLSELGAEASRLTTELERAEFRLLFSGRYDRGDAILAIHAGAGGTDAQDWAEMLRRMYLRWTEQNGYKTEILDALSGEEAGIKRVAIGVTGPFAYGYLKAEAGVHRLVRLSPFDSAHRRHTSFALVEAWPDLGKEVDVQVNESDIEIETFRASSAGGQHMQKNETAVRIRHIPSGIVIACQNERSQSQNKETALRILKARLTRIEEEEQRQKIAELKGEHMEAGWGNQIRSYVLHPYQMVKDHRTDHETGNIQGVLDGDLNAFIEAYLRHTMGEQSD
jgi:peptide chain release factor 2